MFYHACKMNCLIPEHGKLASTTSVTVTPCVLLAYNQHVSQILVVPRYKVVVQVIGYRRVEEEN